MARLLLASLLLVALGQVAALQVGTAACNGVSRAAAVRMAFPSIEDARSLSDEEIESEIFNAKKELFELRKQVKTRQPVKPHVFTHTKRRIGQLQTLLSQRAA